MSFAIDQTKAGAEYQEALRNLNEQTHDNLSASESRLLKFRQKFRLPWVHVAPEKYAPVMRLTQAEFEAAASENPTGCKYAAKNYEETVLPYFTSIRRKILKSKISTMGDLIGLTKRIVDRLCAQKPNSKTGLTGYIHDFETIYNNRDQTSKNIARFSFACFYFCLLVHVLSSGIKKQGMVRKCVDYGNFGYFDNTCDDLRLLVDLTDISQACDGMIDKKILGLIYSQAQKKIYGDEEYGHMLLYYLDISSGLALGIEDKSTYMDHTEALNEFHDMLFSPTDIAIGKMDNPLELKYSTPIHFIPADDIS